MFFLYSLNNYLKSIAFAFYATGLTLLLGLGCSVCTVLFNPYNKFRDGCNVLRLIQTQEKQPLRGGRVAREHAAGWSELTVLTASHTLPHDPSTHRRASGNPAEDSPPSPSFADTSARLTSSPCSHASPCRLRAGLPGSLQCHREQDKPTRGRESGQTAAQEEK